MKPDSKWFKDRMTDKGLTGRSVSDMLGMSYSTYSRLISGHRRWQLQDAVDIGRVLGRPTEEVLHRAGVALPPEPTRRVPIVGVADKSGRIGTRPAAGPRVAERPSGLPDDAAAIQVRAQGDPMDGWALYFVPSARIEPDAIDKLSVVTINSNEKWLRVLNRGYERGRWTLRLLGDPADEMLNLTVKDAAPVLFVRT